MNTPEKLMMLGFHKADPDAELKPITPRAWQGLSINPLDGQPEADLKAVGRRREYGAATKDDGGPVIWTGLCFDRKQFVAAFVTGDCNEPPTHTPAVQPAQLAGRATEDASQILHSGAPGRPTSMHLIEAEYRARRHRGEAEASIGAEAKTLAEWLQNKHPNVPRLKPKSIANRLRHEHRERRTTKAQN